ncbi:MAG: LapA family protein [Mycobacteriales bacterium]
MVAIGLILVILAAVVVVAALTSNTQSVVVHLWGLRISNLSVSVVFIAGLLTTVVAVAGVMVLAAGMRRAHRVRKENRALARENKRLGRTPTSETMPTAPAPIDGDPPNS